MSRLLLALFVLLCSGVLQAAELVGRVVGISDGDTITVLDAGHTQYKIRIAGIDAPEHGQPFGDRSRSNLVRMVAGKDVTASCHKQDRYERQVCKVRVQPSDCPTCGHTLDVGHAQILAGLAWW